MSGHTPGPWDYIDASKSAIHKFAPSCVIRGNGKQIASFSWGDPPYWPVKDESQANARLIAAAPELLEALKLAVRQNSHDMLMTGEELRICTAAIARATGEQS